MFENWTSALTSSIPSYLYAPVAFLAWFSALWLIKRLLFLRLRRWAQKTQTRWDDAIIRALSFPLNFLILASGLVLLETLLPLSGDFDRYTRGALQGCLILAIVLFADRMLMVVIDQYAHRKAFAKVSPSLVNGLIRGFIIAIGSMIFLDMLGISITPILASLGIGSLAVALALQDTLSNLFAGIYMAVDRPIQEGDFVKLETGDEGYVIDVGWRSTKIRNRFENVVIIPNSKLSGSVLTNYYLPTMEVVVPVTLGVHYSSDLEQVERVTLDVARLVLKSDPSAVAAHEPVVRFTKFGDSAIEFVVVLRAKEQGDSATVQHEFIKRLLERYRKEEIHIPYPSRTIYLQKEA